MFCGFVSGNDVGLAISRLLLMKTNEKAHLTDRDIETVSVITLGCSKNIVDSETLMGEIEAQNLALIENPANADALIINTCGFIDKAKEESVDTILEAIKLKEEGTLKKLIVAGCLSDRYGKELAKEMPEVDHFFGTMAFSGILKTLVPDYKYALLGERKVNAAAHFAYVKISEGCDNPCSFCAIPLMRGGHKSKPIERIVGEVRSLTAKGIKEIILIAQDLTYYGLDIYRKRALAELLQRISDVDGVEWIRMMYAYPAKFPKDILPVMAERDNICKYLDMPLQHISTNVLKSMRRGITRRATEELIAHIRDEVPGIALRTTLICGYPAETQESFEELCDFVRSTEFDRLGVFEYSQEENTYADILGDPIPEAIKAERRQQIMDIQREIALTKNESLIGSCLKTIVDEERSGEFQARSEYDAPEVDNEVFIRTDRYLQPGTFAYAKIYDASEYDLYAEYVESPAEVIR